VADAIIRTAERRHAMTKEELKAKVDKLEQEVAAAMEAIRPGVAIEPDLLDELFAVCTRRQSPQDRVNPPGILTIVDKIRAVAQAQMPERWPK